MRLRKARLALVYSIEDPVGVGVAGLIRELVGADSSSCPGDTCGCWRLATGEMLACYNLNQLYFEFLDATPDPNADVIIVLSKHKSRSGMPSLTVHYTGNPTRDNSMGGDPYTLSYSAPPVGKALLKNYYEVSNDMKLLEKYTLTLEATHHGPTGNRKPLVFIEIGSTENEWRDPRAQSAMAEAVVEVLERGVDPGSCRVVSGYGGTHYPAKFTKLMLETENCMGHMIPKYAFNKGVTPEVIEQSIMKNWPQSSRAVIIEKKSIKAIHRKMVQEIAENLELSVEYV